MSTDVDAAIAIAERRAEDFRYGDDWMALAAVGDNGDLVGTAVADLEIGDASERHATLDQADLFDDLPTEANELPFVLAGTVTGGSSEPPELVAAVNGTIAGVVGGYRPEWRRLGVHRLRRRPLRDRSQRGGVVRGHPRRRQRDASPGDMMTGSIGSQWYRVRVPLGSVSDVSTLKRRLQGAFPVVTVVGIEHAGALAGQQP